MQIFWLFFFRVHFFYNRKIKKQKDFSTLRKRVTDYYVLVRRISGQKTSDYVSSTISSFHCCITQK